jgi:hypothetical protein
MNPLERGPRLEPNLSRGTALDAIDETGPRSSSHDWISQLMLSLTDTHGWEYKSVKGTSRDTEEEASPKNQ